MFNGADDSRKPEVDGRTGKKLIKLGLVLAALIAAFFIGLIPMWLQARTSASELEDTKKLLIKEQITSGIATAVSEARRGEYEAARNEASSFFSGLRVEIDKGEDGAFGDIEEAKLQQVFQGRDNVITLLARKDPASAERLTDTYIAYFDAIGRPRNSSGK